MTKSILAFAGSTRKGSFNKQLIKMAVESANKQGAKTTLIDLKDYPVPLYDGDLEEEHGMPKNAEHIRNLMIEHKLIMISTPEYNSSLPAVLKNLIDWMSRSVDGKPSREAFEGKKFVIMSASPSRLGGSRALKDLRKILEELKVIIVSDRVTVPLAHEYFAASQRAPINHLDEEIKTLLS